MQRFFLALVCAAMGFLGPARASARPVMTYVVWPVAPNYHFLGDGVIRQGTYSSVFADVCPSTACRPVARIVRRVGWYCLGFAWVGATPDLPARHYEAHGFGESEADAVRSAKRGADGVKWWVEEPRCLRLGE